ncbi:MAG TPA: phenylalanine--tRNA ligase beta subunit-related protein [Actinomycetota bacterium]|nr:phenylalanine--tRNA ligase beta subunit-related protein [Actinomycetota bacterium]
MSDGWERAEAALSGAEIAPEVLELRPDYTVLLLVADGLTGGPTDAGSDALLAAAERAAAARTAPIEELEHVAQWREAFRSFGAKPQRTRNSVEALLRRVPDGLPRVNRLTDIYNAVSVMHVVPIGGEDLDRYVGPPRLVRANGDEAFDTVASGEPVVESPEPGEVVWCDDAGVTCRRWNWRQCRRTQLTDRTTTSLFILDCLAAVGPDGARNVGALLRDHLAATNPGARFAERLLPSD